MCDFFFLGGGGGGGGAVTAYVIGTVLNHRCYRPCAGDSNTLIFQ